MSYNQLLQKAIELHQQGNLDEAETIYRQLLETAPENAKIMHFLAMIAVAKGAFDTAIDLLYEAISLDKKSAPLYFNLGMALQGKGYYNEAVEQYKKAIKYDESFAPEAYNNIGNAFKVLGDTTKAKEAYLKAISSDENAFYAYNGLGLLLREQGKADEAMEAFQKAIDIAPMIADSYANLATSLRAEGRFDEAMPLYEKALSLDDNNPAIYHSMGIALELLGREEDAFNAYKKALELNQDFPEALAHLAGIYMQKKEWKEAEKLLRKAVDLDPEMEDAWVNLGVVLHKRELYLESMESYRKAILINPKNAEVCNNLAISVHASGDLREATGLCFNAFAINPLLKAVHYNLANILADMFEADKEEAIAVAKAWVKHCPDNEIALHTLASFTEENTPLKAEEKYLKTYFDAFADSFDERLKGLEYKVPYLIAKEIASLKIEKAKILDLGCGSGLCGKEIKQFASLLYGVDLSEKMLEKAKALSIYDDLYNDEIERYLNSLNKQESGFDVITAADTLCYFGKIDNLINGVFEALNTDGAFIFTLETGDFDKDFILRQNGRYAHNENYVKKLLKEKGFTVQTSQKVILRKEKAKDVNGLLFTAIKK